MDGPAAGGDSPTAIERWRAFDATVHARLADSPRPAAVEHLTLDGFGDLHRYLPSGSATAVLVVLAVTVFVVGAFSLLIVALEGTPLFLVLIGVLALFAFLSDAVPDVIFWVLFGGA